jgi:hypothetical protein
VLGVQHFCLEVHHTFRNGSDFALFEFSDLSFLVNRWLAADRQRYARGSFALPELGEMGDIPIIGYNSTILAP